MVCLYKESGIVVHLDQMQDTTSMHACNYMLYETYMYINIASGMQTCLLGSSCRSMIISCNIRYMQQIRVGNLLSLHHHSELTYSVGAKSVCHKTQI